MMVQTFDDMLAHQTTKSARIEVWVRACVELPFYVIKEALNSTGENRVSKPSFINKRFVIIVSLLIVLLGLFFSRNWVLSNFLPNVVAQATKGSSVQMLETHNYMIEKPFETLADAQVEPWHRCSNIARQGIKINFACDTSYNLRFKLNQTEQGKTDTLRRVQAIEKKLEATGYKAGSNGVTLYSLISGTYEGKDYTPDAFYQRNTAVSNCMFDTSIAYSNPSDPAVSMQLLCSRLVAPLGGVNIESKPF